MPALCGKPSRPSRRGDPPKYPLRKNHVQIPRAWLAKSSVKTDKTHVQVWPRYGRLDHVLRALKWDDGPVHHCRFWWAIAVEIGSLLV